MRDQSLLQLMAKVVQKVRWIYILWYIFLILLSVAWYRSDKFQWRWWKWGQFFLRFAESSCYDDKIFPSYFICKIFLFTIFFFFACFEVIGSEGPESTGMPLCRWLKKGSLWKSIFRGICLFYKEHCQGEGNHDL